MTEEERQRLRRRLGGSTWVAPEGSAASTSPSAVAAATPPPRRRRKSRRAWFKKRRYVIPLLLMLVLAGGSATALLRAESTVNTLQRLSTPPDSVTIQDQSDEAVTNPGVAIDTGPAREALVAAGIDPGADAGGLRDRASNLGGLAEGAAVAAGVRDPSSEALTILVMGVDARPGAQIDIAVRPDALMVLRLDPVTQSCRVLAIPRDTLVELPGYGETKVNHALMVAGVPYQRLVVERFLGITVDRYALIDFAGFQSMVDAVGGVPVNVPSELKRGDEVLFSAGPQTFDGEDALRYARYRGGDDMDVGRVRRQQQLIRALAKVASSRDVVRDVDDLLPAVEDHVRTDLSPVELAELGKQYTSTCSDERLRLDTLPGQLRSTGTPDPLFKEPLTYNITDPEVVAARVAALLGRDPAAP